MFRRFIDPVLLKVLTEEANKTANIARRNASWSRKIPGAISVGNAETDGRGNFSIAIEVDLDKAPEAAAFEYGSGIHGERGETYRIPKEGGAAFVAFPLERLPNYRPPPNKKYHYFTYVNHPGVAAKPYLAPAIQATRSSMVGRIANVLGRGILDAIKTEFKNVEEK